MDTKNAPTPSPRIEALAGLIQQVRSLLVFQQSMGIEGYPQTPALDRFRHPDQPRRAERPASPRRSGATPDPQPVPPAAAHISLADIREELGECTRCPLHAGRKSIVFGNGTAEARLFIVGEFPAAADDEAGLPFQGETGALLEKMLAAIGLGPADVYLTHLVKCHPAGGNAPQAVEIATCLPFLHQQISVVRPRVICAMGGLAAQALLHTKKNLLQLRGNWHRFQQIPLMPTFDPAFLLRNPEMKKGAWVDLQLIQKRLATTAPR